MPIGAEMRLRLRWLSLLLLLALPPATQAIFIPPPPPHPLVPARIVALPVVPSSSTPIELRIADRYGAGEYIWNEPVASVRASSIRIDGSTVYVTAELSTEPASRPPFVSIPPLPEGRYTIVYDGSAGLTHPEVHRASIEIVVADSGFWATVVEYFNARLGHYFITADAQEINLLDRGGMSDWVRTGETFQAFAPHVVGSQISGMCRLYGLPGAGIDSHFFASNEECDIALSRWPNAWVPESRVAFGRTLMDLGANQGNTTCTDAGRPLYRLYNNRPDANHRYTTSRAIRDAMLAKGWISEGPQWDFNPIVPGDIRQFEMCVPR